ncbi:Hsp20/alpha crystallin family protein [Metabacillus sp. GX 13764]|uniref:Hsp20/alpha crystallin family protein n=1 Tax=Metabacillus kandeliae TaxID=2900151 RepID=UPI001E5688D3|nr:Hsp20/alpha crystallin family protein [Metabacillus kandeliae]MCD7033979.1 Hsp20/alpha crystallin family protein [Metabacillus kandeliae]
MSAKKSNPMKMINDFFQQRPENTLLGTIDELFQHPAKKPSFLLEKMESETHVILRAELPGVHKDEIHVELLSSKVRIKVNRKKRENEAESETDLKYNGAVREADLLEDLNFNEMKAVYQHGILKLYFPKKKGRRIEIQ